MQEMKKEDARVLLQSTQQLRTHWSSVIVSLINYVIVLNLAIWSFLGKAYIDSLARVCSAQPLYVELAALLSSLCLLTWRLYTHYLDHNIAGLYPDFLLYERTLSLPREHGTTRYLTDAVPNLRLILLDGDLTHPQQLQGTSKLIRLKHIGSRGHLCFDLIASIIMLVLFGLSLWAREALSVLNAMSLILLVILLGAWLFYFHKNPSEKLIRKVISEIKNPTPPTRSSGQ